MKTIGVGGEGRGFDPGKKVKGGKRHLLVDTEELVMRAKVHSAGVFDRDGIEFLLEPTGERFPRLSHLWLDAGTTARARIGWRRRWGSRRRWCGPRGAGCEYRRGLRTEKPGKRYRENRAVCGGFARPGTLPKSVW